MSANPEITGGPSAPLHGVADGAALIPAQHRVAAKRGVPTQSWLSALRLAAVVSDVLVVALATTLGVLAFWTGQAAADRAHIVSGLIGAVLLLVALPLARAWDGRVLGTGTSEFKRIMHATVGASVVLGLGGLTLLVASVRVWTFLLVPLIGLLVMVARFALRKWLHAQRRRGSCSLAVLAVGDEKAIADMVRRTRRDPYFGWRVAGACTPTGRGSAGSDRIEGVPVVGDLDSAGVLAPVAGYQVVAVCQAPGWGPGRLQRLAWDLEDSEVELAVDPGLMEIAGPRMHITPVDGLPLLRLSQPRFTGAARVMKTAMDRSVAALLLLLSLPILITVALAVRRDGGPAFFRQERVGTNGRTFTMFKFRSMVVDAEARLEDLVAANEAEGPLFKVRSDPRITRIGAMLRRYSIDELPQLFNVLNGTMSLVGPRPPLPAEVAAYEDAARRRLMVRPGMTGLWQVSGRSDLSWEESVRLDLRYVENWSLALDLTVLWKTVGAVVKSNGAY